MKVRTVFVASLAVLTLLALYVLFREGSATTPGADAARTDTLSPQATTTRIRQISPEPGSIPDGLGAHFTTKDKENLGKILTVFKAPIDFYGKVQDQYGKPVAGARVHYSVADQYFGDSSKYEGTSSSDGSFSIIGSKGAGLFVDVYKDGYDGIHNQSGGSFGYGMPGGRQAPTKDNPAHFVLRKKAEAEPLIVVDRDFLMPKDGSPLDISLRTGKVVPSGQGDLRIECWVDDQHRDARKQYEWHLRLNIPDGGLMERQNTDFAFEAPTDGYQSIEEFGMPQSAERWRDSFEKQYFAKLGNGTFVRMRVRITTGGDHFASITSYLNPKLGSRELEYDPQKEIRLR